MRFSKRYDESKLAQDVGDLTISLTITSSTYVPSLGFSRDAASSATSLVGDPHAVPIAEAQAFYAGLPSDPRLIYRSEKEEWSPPSGPEAQRRKKQLRAVFNHPIVDVWNNDLGWKVVDVLDARKVSQCVSVISSSFLTVSRFALRQSTLYISY